MAHPKKSREGREERLDVLQRHDPRSLEIFNDALKRFPRKAVSPDDILDALVNALAAARLTTAGATLPEDPPTDRHGLPMEMVFALPSTRQSWLGGKMKGPAPDEPSP
jgi:predicted RNase H-like nuclease